MDKQKALTFAKSLQGRERTPAEKKFAAEHPDKLDYFYIYGIQDDTQAYIDATIAQLEALRPGDIGSEVIIEMRLEWSAKALGQPAPDFTEAA